jgi:hypothetical protein
VSSSSSLSSSPASVSESVDSLDRTSVATTSTGTFYGPRIDYDHLESADQLMRNFSANAFGFHRGVCAWRVYEPGMPLAFAPRHDGLGAALTSYCHASFLGMSGSSTPLANVPAYC